MKFKGLNTATKLPTLKPKSCLPSQEINFHASKCSMFNFHSEVPHRSSHQELKRCGRCPQFEALQKFCMTSGRSDRRTSFQFTNLWVVSQLTVAIGKVKCSKANKRFFKKYTHFPVPFIFGTRRLVTWYVGNWELGSKYIGNWKIRGTFD